MPKLKDGEGCFEVEPLLRATKEYIGKLECGESIELLKRYDQENGGFHFILGKLSGKRRISNDAFARRSKQNQEADRRAKEIGADEEEDQEKYDENGHPWSRWDGVS